MPLINLSVDHGQTLDVAKAQLAKAVGDTTSAFGALVQRVDWSDGRDTVTLSGRGFEVRMWVDAHKVHATGDLPLLGRLLAKPFEAIVRKAFPKQLT